MDGDVLPVGAAALAAPLPCQAEEPPAKEPELEPGAGTPRPPPPDGRTGHLLLYPRFSYTGGAGSLAALSVVDGATTIIQPVKGLTANAQGEVTFPGNVTLANCVGNGVADDKLVYTYVPDLIRYYLSEEPVIPGVDTWRMEEPAAREEVLDRLDELVLKPVDGSGGKGIVIGPAASQRKLDKLRSDVLANPRGWIAQPVVQLSTVPTMIDGKMRPRHVDLRPFAVNSGSGIYVLPGGLTRVALPEGELIVNSSQGGGSKDTWVLARDGVRGQRKKARPQVTPMGVPLVDIGVEGHQQHQEQQQQANKHQTGCTKRRMQQR